MKRTAWAGLALALWCGAAADANLTGVQVHKAGQGVQILVQGEDLAKPKILRLNGNRSYMLEFQAALVGRKKHIDVHYGGVEYVAYGWFSADPPVVRVHLWLKPNQSPQLSQSGKEWVVSVNAPAPDAAGPSSEPHVATPASVVPASYGTVKRRPAPAPVAPSPETKLISLDGSNVDVVQILRMLAMESGANIIAGPEVAGKVNVSLRRVMLKEALDYVTTLASVRYAKVGQTYVVTSDARFAEAMRQIEDKLDETGETRVVQLVSGEGAQLKAAAFKALPQYTPEGSYDIILPTDDIKVGSSSGMGIGQKEEGITGSKSEATQQGTTGQGATPAGGPSAQGAASSGPSTGTPQTGASGSTDKTTAGGVSSAEGKTEASSRLSSGVAVTSSSADRLKTGAKDPYLLVVGSPARVQAVVDFVKSLDGEVAQAANVGPNKDISTKVVPIYCAQVPKIRTALQDLIARDPRKAAFHVEDSRVAKGESESTSPSMPDMDLLFLTGPRDELEELAAFAQELDKQICEVSSIPYATTPEEAKRIYEVVDLENVEPIEAARQLSDSIRGLQARMLPSPVDPLIIGQLDPTPTGPKAPAQGTFTISNQAKQETGGTTGAQGGQTGTAAPTGGATGAPGSGSSPSGTSPVETSAKEQAAYNYGKTIGAEPMRLLLYGTRKQIEAGKDLLKMIDVEPKQVAVDLRVMELTRSDALNLGLDWSILTGGSLKTIELNEGQGGTIATPGYGSTTLNLDGSGSISALSALDRITDKNKIINRPNVLVNDGRPASMFVGDHITYVSSIQATTNGTTVTTATLDVGVNLLLTARVGANDTVTLDLRPSLSILTSWQSVTGGGQIPETSSRTETMVVTVKSGETIALGGLIQDQDKKEFAGVPLLRDLPIVGALFSRTTTTKSRSEVVFFLTTKIVSAKDRASAAHPQLHDNLKLPGPAVDDDAKKTAKKH
jgi:type II secretory pathway component GspD/PulD (secretin)